MNPDSTNNSFPNGRPISFSEENSKILSWADIFSRVDRVYVTERNVEGCAVPTLSTSIVSNVTLDVEAGTNGYHGGDWGHGCTTYVKLKAEAGCLFPRATYNEPDSNTIESAQNDLSSIEIIAGGDDELESLIVAFRFIAYTLEAMQNRQSENRPKRLSSKG